jgi:hypothetical protein
LLARLRTEQPDGEGIREFVRILRLHETFPAALIDQAIEQALAHGCAHLEGVRLCLHHHLHPEAAPPPLDLDTRPHLHGVGGQPPSLACYEALLEGVN